MAAVGLGWDRVLEGLGTGLRLARPPTASKSSHQQAPSFPLENNPQNSFSWIHLTKFFACDLLRLSWYPLYCVNSVLCILQSWYLATLKASFQFQPHNHFFLHEFLLITHRQSKTPVEYSPPWLYTVVLLQMFFRLQEKTMRNYFKLFLHACVCESKKGLYFRVRKL